MRFHVDPWSAEYGAPVEAELTPTDVEVNVEVEVPTARWAPIAGTPRADAPAVVFVDGVRRVDARVWIGGDDDEAPEPGVCASYAAGAVHCRPRAGGAAEGAAEVVHAAVERGVLSASRHATAISTRHGVYRAHAAGGSTAEALWRALQGRMERLEVEAAEAGRAHASDDVLVVVDGPLRGRGHVPGAVGLVKTHGVAYLPPAPARVIGALEAGERTPLFTVGGGFARYSWYLRLPGGSDAPWSGVVRLECGGDLEPAAAVALASRVSALLPRYASEPHKDPRAPQNLFPIGGLERLLRHRLGDPSVLYRALRTAAGRQGGGAIVDTGPVPTDRSRG